MLFDRMDHLALDAGAARAGHHEHVREAGDQNAEIGRRPARPFVGEKRAVGAADVDLAQCPGHRVEPGREGYRVEFELSLRSAENTSELQSLMRNSYAVFFLTKKK